MNKKMTVWMSGGLLALAVVSFEFLGGGVAGAAEKMPMMDMPGHMMDGSMMNSEEMQKKCSTMMQNTDMQEQMKKMMEGGNMQQCMEAMGTASPANDQNGGGSGENSGEGMADRAAHRNHHPAEA